MSYSKTAEEVMFETLDLVLRVSALPPKLVFTPNWVVITFDNGHTGLSDTINDMFFFCYDCLQSFSASSDCNECLVGNFGWNKMCNIEPMSIL